MKLSEEIDRKDLVRQVQLVAANRYSHYSLEPEWVASQAEVEQIIEHTLEEVPSAFNSQTTRIVLLTGTSHERLWDIVLHDLGDMKSDATIAKVNGAFKSGIGTILFFEDQEIVKNMQEKFPLYADTFPIYSDQTAGMHQLMVWMQLETLGFGASLQHYNPIIDESVAKEWNLPETWRLKAEMPFGKPLDTPEEKPRLPMEKRFLKF